MIVSVLLLGVGIISTQHLTLTSPLTANILPEYASHIAVEWDLTLYKIFILSAILAQVIGYVFLRNKLVSVSDGSIQQLPHADISSKDPWFYKAVDVLVPILIVMSLWITDFPGAIAQLYKSDRLHHMDTFVGAPGWAAVSGSRLYDQTFSQYGYGMPHVLGKLATILGGFNYEHLLMVIISVAILYGIIFYFFLKAWLNSRWAAILGLLLVFKWHLFWPEPADFFVWKYPSATLVRYFFDIVVFLMIMLHAQNGRKRWIVLAALTNLLAFYYVNDSGLYLWVALVAYWSSYLYVTGSWKKIYHWALVALPLFIVIPAYLNKPFWMNMTEYIQLALGYFEPMKIEHVMKMVNFWPLALGTSMVVTYCMTLLIVGTLCFLRRINTARLVLIPLCCYGLCTFQYFIFRSAPANIFVVVIPFVIIAVYLFCLALQHFFPAQKNKVLIFSCVMVFGCLIFSNAWARYPNIFNRQKAIFDTVKNEQQQRLDIEADAHLIQAWSKPGDRVALLSSFEALLLMTANRKPYFYYFPLITPGEFYMLDFYGMKVYTKSMFQRLMGQLSNDPPPYLFVESKFVSGALPSVYYERSPSFLALISQIRAHYAPIAQGKYLLVLQYKG